MRKWKNTEKGEYLHPMQKFAENMKKQRYLACYQEEQRIPDISSPLRGGKRKEEGT